MIDEMDLDIFFLRILTLGMIFLFFLDKIFQFLYFFIFCLFGFFLMGLEIFLSLLNLCYFL